MPRAAATVVELLHAVEHLDAAALGDFLDGLAGSAAVETSGWVVKERRLFKEKHPQRNREIRRRHRDGNTYGELAMDYGISPSGIAKIIQRGRKFSLDAQTVSIVRAR